jgi:hypothetical protein
MFLQAVQLFSLVLRLNNYGADGVCRRDSAFYSAAEKVVGTATSTGKGGGESDGVGGYCCSGRCGGLRCRVQCVD